MRIQSISAAAVLAFTMISCSQTDSELSSYQRTVSIEATADDANASRTSIHNGSAATPSFFGVMWNQGDQIGVFSANGGENSPLTYNGASDTKNATFTGTLSGTPAYAYYPYSATAGTNPKALTLTLSAEQPATAKHTLTGDYKIGAPQGGSTNRFSFSSVLALGRICVNTAGVSGMEGEELRSVSMTVAGRSIVGDFKLDATATASPTTAASGFNGGSTITVSFPEGTKAAGTNYAFISFFPTVMSGDAITFTVETTTKKATVKLQAAADFTAANVYSLPLTATFLNDPAKTEIVDNGNGTEQPVEPGTTTGTFTCATYNVDGLPNILGINSDGPGSSGSKIMGKRINDDYEWDFWAASEDFDNHDVLTAALTKYSCGTFRGNVTASGNKNTDGLGFFWKTADVKAENESWTAFTSSAGGLTQGANTLISKGYRYYLVTLKDGTEIDVYITHMNTYGSGARQNAQHAQLTQICNALLANNNGRPIIFMGDTNCRYTRTEFMSRLINPIRGAGWTINDPWIDFQWGGDFATVCNWGKSIMAFGPNKDTNAETDDFGPDGNGYGYQKGEIVDKVFYINKPGNKTQIKALNYLVDESFGSMDGTAFGDHYPVVIDFEYTTTK